MSWLWLYKKGMLLGEPVIRSILHKRAAKGKEDPSRLAEREGLASLKRPSGPLIWVHVASVGEAQSMLSVISLILDQLPNAHILVTSVTTTSARILQERLPDRAFHQYVPVDHPVWVRRFLDHWSPNLVLWAESELWPFTLTLLKKRNIPSVLLNARMSAKSFRNWSRAKRLAEDMLSVFTVILAQTKEDAHFYQELGGRSIVITDNIKYSAKPLPFHIDDYERLRSALANRPVWLYASSHADEEALACKVHSELMREFPDLLTIIAPRHPARAPVIENTIHLHDLTYTVRGKLKALPQSQDQVYLADTMGELGLLYRAVPIACIGRSFSTDGGGGHNPIEAAILGCGVVHGPLIQNLQRIYDDMDEQGAAILIPSAQSLAPFLREFLSNHEKLQKLRETGFTFASKKARIMDDIVRELEPAFLMANLPLLKAGA